MDLSFPDRVIFKMVPFRGRHARPILPRAIHVRAEFYADILHSLEVSLDNHVAFQAPPFCWSTLVAISVSRYDLE